MITPRTTRSTHPLLPESSGKLSEPGDSTLEDARNFEALMASDPDYPQRHHPSAEPDYEAWLESITLGSDLDDPPDDDLIGRFRI